MALVEVTKVSGLPPGTMKSYPVGDKQVLVVNLEGQYYALNGKCTHAGGDLSNGKLDGKVVICPRHGARFDVTSGECVQGPRIGIFSPKIKNEQTYRVLIEGTAVKVEVG
jgi:3-phenylpropionate/trans-cinnamate dioxygenase ferredoxin subunit